MGISEEIDLLCRWNNWANGRVLEAVRESSGQPIEALAAIQHVFATEITWLRRIDRAADPWGEPWGEPSLAQCDEWSAEVRERVLRLASRTDDELMGLFSYSNSRGQAFTDVLQRSALHMLMHSSQYRGEAAGFINHSGGRVGDLDYMGWLRRGQVE
jgi:uncharacterized damage-inducible protein DinB